MWSSKGYLRSHIHHGIIHKDQIMEITEVSNNRWTDKDVGYIYTTESYSVWKKREPCNCDNTDESRGHYVKRNKPSTGRQILHDLTLYVEREQAKLTEADNEWGWPGVGAVRIEKILVGTLSV